MRRAQRRAIIKQKAIKRRIILLIFVYLIFVTLYFSINTLSKYTAASSGDGNIQIAKWSVNAIPTSSDPMNIIAGTDSVSYELTVTSTSEVGCTYSIVLSNLPNGVKVKLDEDSPIPVDSSGTIIFDDCGHFNAGSNGETKTHTLVLTADLGTPDVSKLVNIDVLFVQEAIN